MKALTVRQPWAWAIVHAGKRIENRTRQTHFRGRFYIHAGLAVPDFQMLIDCETRLGATQGCPDAADFTYGAPIATAELVDCVRLCGASLGPWGEADAWHWIIDCVKPLRKPIPAKGQLGMWEYVP